MLNLKRLNQHSIAWIVMVLSIMASLFMIWFLLNTDRSISLKLDTFEQSIANIKPVNGKDVTLEQVAKAVGRYCAERNSCSGLHGIDGIPGSHGADGQDGRDGRDGQPGMNGQDGLDGTNGADGLDGANGQPGAPGRTLEQRCVVIDQTTRRIEQKYTDIEDWDVLYYLSKGQTCPEENE